MYERLQPDLIVETLRTLGERIEERFPGASLAVVATDLGKLAAATTDRLAQLERPRPVLRALIGVVILVGLMLLGWIAYFISRQSATTEAFGMIQGIDAGFNILVLMGGALYFLTTLELRIRRRRSLKDLHKLRSIVHIIDMHQLTKDPSAVLAGGQPTRASPKRTLSSFELMRYLDYCSEMLSLTGKVAALYAQSSPDPVVIAAVNDLENLASSLTHKIWQKILIVQTSIGQAGVAAGPAPAAAAPPAATGADAPAALGLLGTPPAPPSDSGPLPS